MWKDLPYSLLYLITRRSIIEQDRLDRREG